MRHSYQAFMALLFCAAMLTGCSTPRNIHKLSCNTTPQAFADSVTSFMSLYNIEVDELDIANGYLKASNGSWGGARTYWRFSFKKNSTGTLNVLGEAMTVTSSTVGVLKSSEPSREVEEDGSYPEDFKWYYVVKEKIEALCGVSFVVTESDGLPTELDP